jgi:hypothetical protein
MEFLLRRRKIFEPTQRPPDLEDVRIRRLSMKLDFDVLKVSSNFSKSSQTTLKNQSDTLEWQNFLEKRRTDQRREST